MSYNAILITVLVLYLAINLGVGLYASKTEAKRSKAAGRGFINSYFIGGRSMGGLVLGMTLITTFTSASSFIGGPGVAYSRGLAWVYLSVIQIPTAFIILGILGKKFAIIARKTEAVTVTDYLRSRYKSPAVVIISSIALILFFMAQMVSQFLGGAILFETITGLPYIYGLVLFGAVVIIYTSLGGFRAVVVTDTIQGLIMVLGGFIILGTIISVGGGVTAIVAKLNVVNPVWNDISSGGTIPRANLMSFWVLVGVGVLGLPQTAVRGMGFKDTGAMHSAMIYGTVVVGFLMLVMHIAGVFGPAVLDPAEVKSSDYVIPAIVLKYMHPAVAGLFIAAPLSAVMSTVSSLLLLASAAIVKDLYLNYLAKNKSEAAISSRKISRLSTGATFVVGAIVFLFTIYPPDLIVWINLFAMGGLECAFLCPILFGLYWKRANAAGALCSALIGVAAFLIITTCKISFFGASPIVPSILISVAAFVIGSLFGPKPSKATLDLFFS
jgi:sodium/pantothenate symporter